MKSPYFIALNVFGIIFSIYALLIVVSWISNFDLFFPNKYQVLVRVSGMALIVLVPIVSFIILKFGTQYKFGKLLGYTYLTLWLVVLIRIFTLLN
jgi:hypothetical protein